MKTKSARNGPRNHLKVFIFGSRPTYACIKLKNVVKYPQNRQDFKSPYLRQYCSQPIYISASDAMTYAKNELNTSGRLKE